MAKAIAQLRKTKKPETAAVEEPVKTAAVISTETSLAKPAEEIAPPKATKIIGTKRPRKDDFPDVVPPITQPKPAKSTPSTGIDSLKFDSTDVVQILKALSLQSHVNIIVSPEVSPDDKPLKLTLSLTNVTVTEALDFVTSLAGLRYALVGDSYVVTRSDRFGDVMRQLAGRNSKKNVIRVVPITSGEGAQIKKALNQWFGPMTLEVLTPATKVAQRLMSKPRRMPCPAEHPPRLAAHLRPPARTLTSSSLASPNSSILQNCSSRNSTLASFKPSWRTKNLRSCFKRWRRGSRSNTTNGWAQVLRSPPRLSTRSRTAKPWR
jgi:hypothetical protein